MHKRKVLILQEEITQYRIPILNLLAEKVDLTVAYLKPSKLEGKINFKQVVLNSHSYKNIYHISNLRNFCNNYEVVFYMPHLKIIDFFLLPFKFDNKFKTVAWTNGTRASYTQIFDLDRDMGFLDHLYFLNLRRADAVILYIEEAERTVNRYGVDSNKVFFAHNTVAVNYDGASRIEKNSILFVGTLYKGKGVDELIDCYSKAYHNAMSNKIPLLEIVGKGTELSSLQKKAEELGLKDKIIFHGAIYDENILAQIFQRALICVSPNQAGLSVLKSLGYGVPFITKENAITGGEIVNVKDGYNGVLYSEPKELVSLFKELTTNTMKYVEMGKNARNFYLTHASPEGMVKGFINTIDYLFNK